MGKHEVGYVDVRPDKDLCPTPSWVTGALCEHVDIVGKAIWECAAGTGQMADALKANGAARVFCSDIHDYGYDGLNGLFDFVSDRSSNNQRFSEIVTNPPYGLRNTLAEKFIEIGLQRLPPGGFLALLLPVDLDAAKSRQHLFRDNSQFVCKVILTRRIVWFERSDGTREAPKENHGWFIWQRPGLDGRTPAILRPGALNPVIRYAPCTEPAATNNKSHAVASSSAAQRGDEPARGRH